jgi:hypothetical protein
MNTKMKASTLSALRYIHREDLIVHNSYEVFEQISDYVRTLHPEFTEAEVETVVLIAMKLAIA